MSLKKSKIVELRAGCLPLALAQAHAGEDEARQDQCDPDEECAQSCIAQQAEAGARAQSTEQENRQHECQPDDGCGPLHEARPAGLERWESCRQLEPAEDTDEEARVGEEDGQLQKRVARSGIGSIDPGAQALCGACEEDDAGGQRGAQPGGLAQKRT